MTKILLFALIVWLVIMLLKRHQGGQTRHATPPEKTGDIVPCAVCGVHVPKIEAIFSQNLYYCSEAHFLARKK